jgi:hypothetical protein
MASRCWLTAPGSFPRGWRLQAAGLVAACGTRLWRLYRHDLRRWRRGQAIYRDRRITVVSAWGVEGQPPPTNRRPSRA